MPESQADQGRALTGARRHGAAYEPTGLVDVEPSMRVVCEEVFGPVVTVQRYQDLPPLFEQISAAQYGLHCGIFTKSLQVAFDAIRALRVGGVIVNGTSTWRTDQLAYGGVKSSGIGREGPRYAMRDMTEERLVLFNL
jgi:acyl-CoA reductase-like NAD-dependent aldehyde dehydrogenase